MAFQGGAWTTSVVGNVGLLGTIVTSMVSTVPSSVIVGTSIFGQLPAGTAPIGSIAALQGTNPWIMTGSVQGFPTTQNVSGSVVATQGTTPWNIAGSVATSGTVNATLVAPSIVGTYAEDAAHTTASQGLFVLGVRNDTVASFVSADTEYSPLATDSAGRVIGKPFAAEEGAYRFTGSVVSGSVTLIRASAIGQRQYITDFWIANTHTVTSVATLVTFQDGSTSIIARTIAPAGGGSNSPGIAMPLRTNPSQDLAFTASPAPSILYVTVSGYQAP